LRESRGKVRGDPASQRIPHQRRLRDFQFVHESVKKFDKSFDLVFEERLVGLAESDLVKRHGVEFSACGPEVGRPARRVGAQAVQENYRRALPGFVVTDAAAENRGGLLLRQRWK